MDGFFSGAFGRNQFITSYLQSGVFKSVRYTLPFMGEVMIFSVNKPMLRAAGLLGTDGQAIAPKTWSDLPVFCKKLTAANGGKPGCSIHWGFSFAAYDDFTCLLGEQGMLYEKGANIVDFSSPAAHERLAVGRELIENGWSMSETVSDDNGGRWVFVAGTVGAILEAASREAEAAATLGSDKMGLMAAPGTEQNGTIVFSHAVYIPKMDSANARACARIRARGDPNALVRAGRAQKSSASCRPTCPHGPAGNTFQCTNLTRCCRARCQCAGICRVRPARHVHAAADRQSRAWHRECRRCAEDAAQRDPDSEPHQSRRS